MKFKPEEIKLNLISLRNSGKYHWEIAKIYGVSKQTIINYLNKLGEETALKSKYKTGWRRCYKCKQTKTIDNFYRLGNGKLNNRCISCTKTLSRKYLNTEKYKAYYRKGGRYYQQTKARSLVRDAVKKGILVKSTRCMINSNCNGRIEGHHYLGYAKENQLKVKWLCTKHHSTFDKE